MGGILSRLKPNVKYGKLKFCVKNYEMSSLDCEVKMAYCLKKFRKWTSQLSNTSHDYQLKIMIIYKLAELFYKWNLENDDMILELLSYVYKCDNSFYYFFNSPLHCVSPKTHLTENQIDFLQLDYFLKKSNKLHLSFGGNRLAEIAFVNRFKSDSPCLGTILNRHPKSFLILLQYGALMKWTRGMKEWNGSCNDWKHIIYTILKSFDFINNQIHLNATVGILNSVPDTILNAKLLLRAIPKLNKSECCNMYRNLDDSLSVFEFNIFHDILLPSLSERYLIPAKLQHLCRCIIRYNLWLNWKLPEGIDQLSLPTFMKNYINLLID